MLAAEVQNPAEINNIVGFNTSANWQNWTFRVGLYSSNDVNIDIQSPEALELIAMLAQAEQFAAISALDVQQERGNFGGIGVIYDNFSWFFGAELTQLEVKNSYIPTQRSGYLTAGKRFGQNTLHATFGRSDDKAQNPQTAVVNNPALSAFVQEAATRQVSRTNFSSIGFRRDLDNGLALKLDYTYADDRRTNLDHHLVSLALHAVF